MPEQSFTVQFSPSQGVLKRHRFKPRQDVAGYLRFVEEWTGCRWRVEGCEPVTDVILGGPVLEPE
jgi:hypothetical protein